jgi:L-ribulose-5-phosphate 3-epimerase UlaE
MKIIAKKNWVYCVLLENDEQILSVPFGEGSVDFSRAFKIPLVSLDEDYL